MMIAIAFYSKYSHKFRNCDVGWEDIDRIMTIVAERWFCVIGFAEKIAYL